MYWDGKLMEDLPGDKKVDRLPIIASSGSFYLSPNFLWDQAGDV